MMNPRQSAALMVNAQRLAALIVDGHREVAASTRPGRTTAAVRQRLHELADQLGDLLRHAGHLPPATVALRGSDGRLLVVRLEYHPKSSTCLRSRGVVTEPAADVDLQAMARAALPAVGRARGEDRPCRV